MRIFFLCNNWLGWQTLQWLRQQGEDIVGLAVHPDVRAKYRNEILREIEGANCVVLDGSQLKNSAVLQQVRELDAEIAVSVLFGYILSPDFINLFPRGCINLHPAFLPYNRGAYPNVWSIVTKTPAGATLHYVDAGVDTGDVIAQKEITVKTVDTGASLYGRLEKESLNLFKDAWPSIRAGTNLRNPQPIEQGSSHRACDVREIDEIDLQKSYRAEDLINVIRARTFPPYQGAYFVHEGRKIYLRLELSEEEIKNE